MNKTLKTHITISLLILLAVSVFCPVAAQADPVVEAPALDLGTFNLRRAPALTYGDEYVSVTVHLNLHKVEIDLKNMTPGIVTVDWDKFFFTDAQSGVSRMIQDGVQYIHRDRPQIQTLLPPGGRVRTDMTPTSNIWWNDSEKQYETVTITDEDGNEKTIKIPRERDKRDNSNWEIRELAPWPSGGRIFNSEEKYMRLYSGKRLSLLMTLVFNDADTRYYVFNFDFPVYRTEAEKAAEKAKPSLDKYLILGDKTADGFIVIHSVAPGCPAEEKGIKAGDILMEIDGMSVADMDIDAAQKYISKKAAQKRSIIVVTARNGAKNMAILK